MTFFVYSHNEQILYIPMFSNMIYHQGVNLDINQFQENPTYQFPRYSSQQFPNLHPGPTVHLHQS